MVGREYGWLVGVAPVPLWKCFFCLKCKEIDPRVVWEDSDLPKMA